MPFHTPGLFVWRELMTRHLDRSKLFYMSLFGWSFRPHHTGPGRYEKISLGEKTLGAIWEITPEMKDAPTWFSFVSVDDVDRTTARAKELGGQLFHGPGDVPGVGRFSVLGDPQGAFLLAFRSTFGDPTPALPKPGEFCWETLVTSDLEGAKAFYSSLFAWKVTGSPSGAGTIFAVDDRPEGMVADVQQARTRPPSWVSYVNVASVDASVRHASLLGAKIHHARIEIPKVGVIALLEDPGGATLGLYQPE